MRQGVMHFRVEGKGNKVRYVPLHPETQRLLSVYLDACGHRDDVDGALIGGASLSAEAFGKLIAIADAPWKPFS